MAWAPPQKVGDTDPTIPQAKKALTRYSYGAPLKGDTTPTYTQAFHDALVAFASARNEQVRRGQVAGPSVNTTGVYDWAMKKQLGTLPAAPPPVMHPNVWLYTAPGSGANYDQGPSFDMGNWCQDNLGITHQPMLFAKGGYLGLMGGDPTFSYNDVIYDEYQSLEWLLDHNPKIHWSGDTVTCDPDLVIIPSGYSQSADGMEDALEILFGDGGFVIPKTGQTAAPGRYRAIRSHIKAVINFGNPSRQPGPTKIGNNPAGWGIARKVRPAWLAALVWSITNDGDFYACTNDNIRPPFYKIIVESNFSLPFFVHVLKVAMGVFENFMPIFGGILGPLAPVIVGGAAGLTNLMPLLTGMMGQAAGGSTPGDDALDAELEALLSAQGILTHFPDLITLIGSLNGIAIHGDYQGGPHAEFGGRNGVQVGCDIMRQLVAA